MADLPEDRLSISQLWGSTFWGLGPLLHVRPEEAWPTASDGPPYLHA